MQQQQRRNECEKVFGGNAKNAASVLDSYNKNNRNNNSNRNNNNKELCSHVAELHLADTVITLSLV